MEQTKGEFEQRPEARPANEVPFSRPRASKAPWILCMILALTSLVLGGFLVYGAINQGEKPKCETVADDQKAESVVEEKSDNKIRDITKKLRDELMAYLGETYDTKMHMQVYEVETGFDNSPVFYEFEDGYVTDLYRTYQVTFSSSDYLKNPYIANKTNMAAFSTTLDKIMSDNGLKRSNSAALEASVIGYGPDKLFTYTNESGDICEVTAGEPLYLNCSNTNWLKEEDKKLAKELIDALKKKEQYAKNSKHVYVGARASDIHKGKSDEYEVITASVTNAAAQFYRKNGGEWVYATSMQAPLYCEDYEAAGWGDIFPCMRYSDHRD